MAPAAVITAPEAAEGEQRAIAEARVFAFQQLEEARDAQRAGKIPLFATLTAEAEEIGQRLDALKQSA